MLVECLRWGIISGEVTGCGSILVSLVVVLEDISAKGRGSIWAVEKGHEEDEHETVPKAKKKSDVEDR